MIAKRRVLSTWRKTLSTALTIKKPTKSPNARENIIELTKYSPRAVGLKKEAYIAYIYAFHNNRVEKTKFGVGS